ELIWGDGTRSRYVYSMLRRECRCTECKSVARRDAPIVPDPTVTVTSFLPIGNYAIRLVFDDGHDRGIFPFAFLRSLIAL
ncbi:MAG TPA: DUF971 domain-containing protein, partial [Burkholderiaceae bacterium]|nr:DUF971 domain-containing protein [Burkholderiaceae bacterium]